MTRNQMAIKQLLRWGKLNRDSWDKPLKAQLKPQCRRRLEKRTGHVVAAELVAPETEVQS